jgi:tRNA dihydrouridine synthase A
MDDVTDNVFRLVVLGAGRPDVFFTEFTNSDGLVHGGHGIPLRKLNFTPDQHPIVAQIWGNNAESMGKAAKIVKDLGFDGIDINMGCPIREVIKKKAGAGLIGQLELTAAIIDAVKKGAKGIPVSVKTRLGINVNVAEEWATFLLKQDLAALTIHARTAKEMSKVPAQWEEIGKIVKLRDEIAPDTLIIGNGDVKSYSEVIKLHKKYGVDGVMIGRGIFDNPWVFHPTSPRLSGASHTRQDYINLLLTHMDLFEEKWGDAKNFSVIKKFFKMYVNNFPGAAILRQKLMEANSFEEIKKLLVTHG